MELIKFHELTPYEHRQRKLKEEAEKKAAKEAADAAAAAEKSNTNWDRLINWSSIYFWWIEKLIN